MQGEHVCEQCSEALAIPGPYSWRVIGLSMATSILLVTTHLWCRGSLLPGILLGFTLVVGPSLWQRNVMGWTLHAYVSRGVCHIHGGGLPREAPVDARLCLVFLLGWFWRKERGAVWRRTANATWTASAWRVLFSYRWRELTLVDDHGHTIGVSPQYRDRAHALGILLTVAEQTESLYEMQMMSAHLTLQRNAAGMWLCHLAEELRGIETELRGGEGSAPRTRYNCMVSQITRTPGITGALWVQWYDMFHRAQEQELVQAEKAEKDSNEQVN
jgi:hypothetical protein